MSHQEIEGLLSSSIRNIRLKQVASHVRENSVILDLACGEGYLSKFLPKNCQYYGIDILPASNDNFSDFLQLDLLSDDSPARTRKWLPVTPDYIINIAFIEHISNPTKFLANYCPLLGKGGRFIGTTPHPRGRFIHDSLSRAYLCSRHAAEEHEKFIGEQEIKQIALASGGNLTTYEQFLFGLNQIFVIEYT